jgi:hypothetical protein
MFIHLRPITKWYISSEGFGKDRGGLRSEARLLLKLSATQSDRSTILNVACAGRFSSDRTNAQYADILNRGRSWSQPPNLCRADCI